MTSLSQPKATEILNFSKRVIIQFQSFSNTYSSKAGFRSERNFPPTKYALRLFHGHGDK